MHTPKKHLSFSSLVDLFRKHLAGLTDTRQIHRIQYTLADVGLSAFACMFFQDPSMLTFQKRLQDKKHLSNFNTLFGVTNIPESTQLRDVLDALPSEQLKPMFKKVFTSLQRGKHLEKFQSIRGKYLVSIDGTQYFTSKNVSCTHCLTREHKSDGTSFHHYALQAALVNPDIKQAIPIAIEDIRNEDGAKKQDCEINAAKRLIPALRTQHPQLDIILLGDGLFSKHSMIEMAEAQRMDYIFTVKPGDHKYLFEWLDIHQSKVQQLTVAKGKSSKGKGKGNMIEHVYRWVEHAPLESVGKSYVNFFELGIFSVDPNTGERNQTYRSSWVTSLTPTAVNIERMTAAARARWKIENQCFNNLKNQGYCLEHNFGHGSHNLAFNFYILTLLAFMFHQVFELTDNLYQTARARWTFRMLWELIRGAAFFFIFTSWEQMITHCLHPPDVVSTA
jgi:hypothetical protein